MSKKSENEKDVNGLEALKKEITLITVKTLKPEIEKKFSALRDDIQSMRGEMQDFFKQIKEKPIMPPAQNNQVDINGLVTELQKTFGSMGFPPTGDPNQGGNVPPSGSSFPMMPMMPPTDPKNPNANPMGGLMMLIQLIGALGNSPIFAKLLGVEMGQSNPMLSNLLELNVRNMYHSTMMQSYRDRAMTDWFIKTFTKNPEMAENMMNGSKFYLEPVMNPTGNPSMPVQPPKSVTKP